ncbi:unnamed protein product [Danaus chrysippus]|uniref:(African queen) hypothetical protein n=1 Tax=Danaus chrysippus TaxID=151541 RepID=A0A8J2QT83_9NEOP|nr:unnamed protein product [Danaus chrysippus]
MTGVPLVMSYAAPGARPLPSHLRPRVVRALRPRPRHCARAYALFTNTPTSIHTSNASLRYVTRQAEGSLPGTFAPASSPRSIDNTGRWQQRQRRVPGSVTAA